jgi:flagellar protein FliL
MAQDPTDTASRSASAPRRRGRWVLFVFVLLALLGGGGASGWWWMHHRAEAGDGHEAEATPPAPDRSAILPLEPFVVNLADRDASRYLRVSLRLVIADKRQLHAIEADAVRMTRVRSEILESLSECTAGELVTAEGKAALKRSIAERASALLQDTQVTDVLFTEFVVQF